MTSKPSVALVALLAGSAVALVAPAAAESSPAQLAPAQSSWTLLSLENALTGGKPTVNLRLRAAAVDRDGFDDKSTALTLRTRLGYNTGVWNGLEIFGEYEGVAAAGGEAYAGTPAEIASKQRFIIGDPAGNELNQIYLKYSGYGGTAIVGRQRVIVNNARMIGNVGWRQNEQTFDGLTLKAKATDALDLELYYFNKSNFIFFNTTKLEGSGMLNARYKLGGYGSLAAYGLLYSVEGDGTNNTKTFGLRYEGSYPLQNRTTDNGLTLATSVEYAQQSDYDDYSSANGDSFSAIYINYDIGLEMNVGSGRFSATLGYELLGSDDGDEAVTFPLATNHKFNGWADIFLFTPDNGLEDISLALQAKLAGWTGKLVYHEFSSDEGSIDYGSEIDLVAIRKISARLTFIAKVAMYNADQFAADTDRLTFDLNYAF